MSSPPILPRSPTTGVGKFAHLLTACALALGAACSPTLPPRYVIEQDVGDYRYRRYQAALDVEIPVPDNPATAHLATYVQDSPALAIVPVKITRYSRSEGLSETLRAVLRSMGGYEYGVIEIAGEWAWQLEGARRDRWVLWTSSSTLVQIGSSEGHEQVPRTLVEAYLDLYPSDLGSDGKAPSS